MPRKIKIRIKISPYLKRVRTKHGKKQRVIHAHRRTVIRNLDTPGGKEELAKEFFVRQFGRSPEMEKKKFEKWKERNLGSYSSSRALSKIFEDQEILDKIRRRTDLILMGSDTLYPKQAREKAINELVREGVIKNPKNFGSFIVKKGDRVLIDSGPAGILKEFDEKSGLVKIDFEDNKNPVEFHKSWIKGKGEPGSPQFKEGNEEVNFGSFGGIRDIERFKDINKMILKRKESILMGSDTLSPETARRIAMDQLVGEGKIKRSELKNRGSSPTTGASKPSDLFLLENLQKNKQLDKRKKLKEKFNIDLDVLEDHSSK